jgi:hypothetical protein
VVRALLEEPRTGEHATETPEEGAIGKPGPRGAWRTRAIAACAAIFLATAVSVLAPISGIPAQRGPATASLDGQAPVLGHPSSPGNAAHNQIQEQEMNRATVAAAAGLIVAGESFAQSAVQWRVEDGGNGHWYALGSPAANWHEAAAQAVQMGGHLATLPSAGETAFAAGVAANENVAYIGAAQAPGSAEPFGGWRWITDEPWGFESWHFNMDDAPCGSSNGDGEQQFLWMHNAVRQWDDVNDRDIPGCPLEEKRGIIEWSADCNNDGIVDYGQCNDGTLPDYDGNNIPDCCEQGQDCVVGTYPVQWKVEDGGNGHWYSARRWTGTKSWPEARDTATALGAMLACITSDGENAWISGTLDLKQPGCGLGQMGWHLGGYQDLAAPDYVEPAGGWRWLSGEPWSYTAWLTGQNYPGLAGGDRPNNFKGDEHFLKLSELPYAPWWDDVGPGSDQQEMCGAILEWSADCNADGIVDYGQILRGDFADINGNGVPDRICECLGDLYVDGFVNGADLGALLAYWGPVTGTPASRATDINRDGVVNGSDLGILLSNWGACAP